MEKFIVYVDDASHALRHLQPMCLASSRALWVLVACPPHLSKHAARWVTRDALEEWKQAWADELFAELIPALKLQDDQVHQVCALRPLPELTEQLQQQHGAARLVDARHPHFGQDAAGVTRNEAGASHDARWQLPGAVALLGATLIALD